MASPTHSGHVHAFEARRICPGFRPRQFEYSPNAPELMVVGTVRGEVALVDHTVVPRNNPNYNPASVRRSGRRSGRRFDRHPWEPQSPFRTVKTLVSVIFKTWVDPAWGDPGLPAL